jgi:hypothetical protein
VAAAPKRVGAAILVAGGVAGTLDILAAFVQAYIKNGVTPDVVLKYIAGGAFTLARSMRGGWEMAAAGLMFHFIIAYALAIFFVLLYTRWPLIRQHIIPAGFGYGVFAWVVTAQGIVPYLSKIGPRPFVVGDAVVAILILIAMIGTPIALITHHYLRDRSGGPADGHDQ